MKRWRWARFSSAPPDCHLRSQRFSRQSYRQRIEETRLRPTVEQRSGEADVQATSCRGRRQKYRKTFPVVQQHAIQTSHKSHQPPDADTADRGDVSSNANALVSRKGWLR
jgi:hypothetical protein